MHHTEIIPNQIHHRVRRYTLPALPIINSKHLEDSCMGLEGSGPVPYALLSGIIAHSIHYLPEIIPLRKNLWHEALLALDDEYRQPRLSTFQLALLQIYSRPMEIGENSGQITIAIARVDPFLIVNHPSTDEKTSFFRRSERHICSAFILIRLTGHYRIGRQVCVKGSGGHY